MKRLGLICLCLLDGALTMICAAAALIAILGLINGQIFGGLLFLLIAAVSGIIGFFVFNKVLDRIANEVANRASDNSSRTE